MGQIGYLALITLFIDMLEYFVLHEDVAVERGPVRHVDFLFPFLVWDCRPLHGLRLFKQPWDVELERQTVRVGWLPVIHVGHVVRLAQLQRGVELLERLQQLLGLAQVDFLDFVHELDVIPVHFLGLLLASVRLALHLHTTDHHARVKDRD